jgi:hypothetical protein
MSKDAAREALERLSQELPPGSHEIKGGYVIPGKLSLQRRRTAPRLVLSWLSNGLPNELTTRQEYAQVLRTWFPRLTRERAKPEYFSQQLSSPAELLSIVVSHGAEIARAIGKVQADS